MVNKKNNFIIVSEWDKKKSLEINACHDPGSLAMPNGDPRDGFFFPTLTLMIYSFIIPHVNSPYKTSIDERLIFYNITRCYSSVESRHPFAIAAGDIIK